jgi:hypothetical protein
MAAIVVVKKTFRYSNVFFYNHLYHPEGYYEKRYTTIQPTCGWRIPGLPSRKVTWAANFALEIKMASQSIIKTAGGHRLESNR